MGPFQRAHHHLLLLLLLLIFVAVSENQPVAIHTVPAVPLVQSLGSRSCKLDLSAELFRGVAGACTGDLDRRRCCPVLAAWLFAAHATSAFDSPPPTFSGASDPISDRPVIPDDSQSCADALQNSLRRRRIHLARPNSTCDPVLCFCGIRIHKINSLSCPAAFNSSGAPTAAVRELEKNCFNSSFSGCTRCLKSLEKLKSGGRRERTFGMDCQLMGLTWLLARNKTAYIATVSAALRAIMYGSDGRAAEGRCSSDREKMPLAVGSLRLNRTERSTGSAGIRWNGSVGGAASLFFSFLVFLCVLF